MKETPPSPRSLNARIAAQVRALRGDAGLSLEALASKSAVSRSMLSLIERGESSPTAVVLEKIACALDVPLGRLFEGAADNAQPLSRSAERISWRDPDSGYVRRNISPPNYPSPIQLVEVLLPPGARIAYETGARDSVVHQQIWLRAGRLEVGLGDLLHCLEEDDCLAMRLDQPTRFHNPGPLPARYIVAISSARPLTNGG